MPSMAYDEQVDRMSARWLLKKINRKPKMSLAPFAVAPFAAGTAAAQLGPDERRQIRREMREHWQQMPQEDRQRYRQEHHQRRDGLQQMPAEDRSRLRDELRGQRDADGWHNFEHRRGQP